MTAWAIEISIALAIVVAIVGAAIYFAPKGWRTFAANGVITVMIVLGAVLDAASGFNWRELLPPNIAPWVIAAITILNVILRTVTTTAPGKSEETA